MAGANGANGNGKPAEGARVGETVAAGYTFQGRLVRPVLVRLIGEKEGNGGIPASEEAVGPANGGTVESVQVGSGESEMTLDASK